LHSSRKILQHGFSSVTLLLLLWIFFMFSMSATIVIQQLCIQETFDSILGRITRCTDWEFPLLFLVTANAGAMPSNSDSRTRFWYRNHPVLTVLTECILFVRRMVVISCEVCQNFLFIYCNEGICLMLL
jgi:hypothetical protein